MAKSKFFSEKPYNVGAQIAGMHMAFPQFKCIRDIKLPNNLIFIGEVQPHSNMPVYKIKVDYRYSKSPRVYVISPELVERPPHFYQESKSLCLYHWDDFEWKKEKQVADTILPWAIGWLFFYEVWKETGVWYGDEANHGKQLKTQKPED